MPTLNADDAAITQVFFNAGEGLWFDGEARGDDALADVHVQDLALARTLGEQVTGEAAGGGMQGKIIDFAHQTAQALAQDPEQDETGIEGFPQHAREVPGIHANQFARVQGRRADRIAGLVQEHQGLGEGLSGRRDLDDLLGPIRGQSE